MRLGPALTLGLALAALAGPAVGAEAADRRRPNIVVILAADTIPDYLGRVVAALASMAKAGAAIDGFDGANDRRCVTDFPGGRLELDTRSLATRFVPKVD